jgi:predicted enzyme related to lactoylglutathione lyase
MKPNPIVWCEIYVQDMDRAKRRHSTQLFKSKETLNDRSDSHHF